MDGVEGGSEVGNGGKKGEERKETARTRGTSLTGERASGKES